MNRVAGWRAANGFILATGAKRRRGQLGQGLLELALVLPLMIMIMVAIADLGRMFYAYITISSAAQKGALYGSSSATFAVDQAGIQSIALADTTTLFDTSSSNPTVTSATSTDPYGDQSVTVTLAYTFRPLFPYPGLPGNFTMSRSTSMRVHP